MAPPPLAHDTPSRRWLNSAHSRRVWRLLLLGLMMAVSWLAFDPEPRPPAGGHGDKLAHALAFVALAATARFALAGPLRGAAAMLAFGVFIEIVQAFIPARTASLADVLADAVGIALGLGLAWLLARLVARLPAPPRP